MIKEYLLATNDFARPKSVSGINAVGYLLIRLLMLVPGTNPLHPRMGVGIGTKYRFITEDVLPSLKTEIESQISTYMPIKYQTASVDLSFDDNNYLDIKIIINGTSYIYETSESNTPVQLSDIIN